MLSALDENGRLVSLLDGIPANQNFVCPACRSAVRLKNGKVMRPHFAHVSLDKCDFYSENESSEHLQLKAALYHAVSRTEQVVVEKVLPDLHQARSGSISSPCPTSRASACATASAMRAGRQSSAR